MGSELDNPVPVNVYDFSETTLNDKQVLVPNAQGRTVLFAELVYLNGYFGDVTDQDGIATAKSGNININSERKIRTEQITITETFVVDATLWFQTGGAGAAGVLLDADPGSGTRVAVGVITGFGGSAGAHTYVEFRPYIQLQATVAAIATNTAAIGTLSSLTTTAKGNLVVAINEVDADVLTLQGEMLVEQAEPKILVFKLEEDASSPVAIAGLIEGDEVVDVHIVCSTANANGTLILETGAADDITDAMICAVDKVVVRAGTIDDDNAVLPATGAAILSVGGTAANTRGIVVITYIPVTV